MREKFVKVELSTFHSLDSNRRSVLVPHVVDRCLHQFCKFVDEEMGPSDLSPIYFLSNESLSDSYVKCIRKLNLGSCEWLPDYQGIILQLSDNNYLLGIIIPIRFSNFFQTAW